MAALPCMACASGVPILSRRLSTSVSILDTKNDATEAISDRSYPFALACSMPARKASITSSYRCSPKVRVTLTLMPAASVAVIAGSPALVAGILMNRLGRSTSHHNAFASALVRSVSAAIRGSTSMETRPSMPRVVGGQHPDRLFDVHAAQRELAHLVGVVFGVCQRLGEDGRVGRDTDHVALPAQLVQPARGQPFPGKVVQPDRHARGG